MFIAECWKDVLNNAFDLGGLAAIETGFVIHVGRHAWSNQCQDSWRSGVRISRLLPWSNSQISVGVEWLALLLDW